MFSTPECLKNNKKARKSKESVNTLAQEKQLDYNVKIFERHNSPDLASSLRQSPNTKENVDSQQQNSSENDSKTPERKHSRFYPLSPCSSVNSTHSRSSAGSLKRRYSDDSPPRHKDSKSPQLQETKSNEYRNYSSRRYSIPHPRSIESKLTPQHRYSWSPVTHRTPTFRPYQRQSHSTCCTDQTPYSPLESPYKKFRSSLPSYPHFNLENLESETGFIDSHCHLDFLFQRQDHFGTYSEYQKQHQYKFPKSYKGCVAVFCNPETFAKKHIWEKILFEDNVWAAFGCHPHNAKDYNEIFDHALLAALKHPKIRALGEIGLDYSNRNNCSKDVQHQVFRHQLQLATDRSLPLVIHCREAQDDCLAVMREMLPVDYSIHLHCFTDSWEWAQKWLEAFPNLCIGLTNLVTFPSAEKVHEVAKNIPLKRLLLETDAPYFLPRPLPRHLRWSHPGMALHAAAQIAALKEVPLEKVLKHTFRNTKRIYRL